MFDNPKATFIEFDQDTFHNGMTISQREVVFGRGADQR
jgi:hypothetical protein